MLVVAHAGDPPRGEAKGDLLKRLVRPDGLVVVVGAGTGSTTAGDRRLPAGSVRVPVRGGDLMRTGICRTPDGPLGGARVVAVDDFDREPPIDEPGTRWTRRLPIQPLASTTRLTEALAVPFSVTTDTTVSGVLLAT